MGVNTDNDIQAIYVYYSSKLNDSSFFSSLLFGMEEEGVPSFVKEKEDETALELGYQAALDSNLGVGIGIGVDGQSILHYTKLAKDHPLFQIEPKDKHMQNILGANAARLVKGIPFKSFDESYEGMEGLEVQEETISEKDIASIVAIVIKRLKELE